MRRRKKIKISRTVLSFLLLAFGFIFIFMCSVGYAYLNQSLQVDGRVTIFVPEQKDFIINYSYHVYATNPYNVDVTVKITNVSDKDVSAWEIFVDLPEGANLKNYYGCELIGNEGYNYHFDNPNGHNDYMAVGESVEFHLQYTIDSDNYGLGEGVVYGTSNEGGGLGGITTPEIDNPITNPCEKAFISDDDNENEVNGDLHANIQINGHYGNAGGTAYYTKVTVTNHGNTNSSYVVILDIGENGIVTGCYEGTCKKEGSLVTIIPPSYSSTLQPEQSKSINYHFTVMPDHEMKLVYVGKNIDGYILACQPNYNGGVTEPTNPDNPNNSDAPIIPNEPVEPEEPSVLSANLITNAHWNSGQNGYEVYQFQLSVTNNGNEAIGGWKVVIENATNADPTGCWNGTCTKTGNTIILENNQSIAPGKTGSTYYQITMPVGTELSIKSVRSN